MADQAAKTEFTDQAKTESHIQIAVPGFCQKGLKLAHRHQFLNQPVKIYAWKA